MTTDPQAPKPNPNDPDKYATGQQPAEVSELANQERTEGAGETVPSESADVTENMAPDSDSDAEAVQPEAAPEENVSTDEPAVTGQEETPEGSADIAPEDPAEASPDSSSQHASPEDKDTAVAVTDKAVKPAVKNDARNSDDDDDDEEEYEDDEYEEEDEDDDKEEHGRMSLFDHLRELKKRLIRAFAAVFVGFLICYAFAEELFNFLVQPLLAVLPKGSKLIYTGLPEAFFTYMKVAFVAGCFLASPVIFYQIWAFIAPGLYDEEKRHVLPIAICSAIFFILGGAFAYFIAFPFAFEFFMSYSTGTIEAQPRLSEYLSFSLQLLFAFGLIFELPLFTFFLAKMGIVTATAMRKFRRYAILVNFIVAAILTPPDVVSQMLMAVPLLILYEVSILVAQVFGKKPKEAVQQEDEAADDAEDEATEDENSDDKPVAPDDPDAHPIEK